MISVDFLCNRIHIGEMFDIYLMDQVMKAQPVPQAGYGYFVANITEGFARMAGMKHQELKSWYFSAPDGDVADALRERLLGVDGVSGVGVIDDQVR